MPGLNKERAEKNLEVILDRLHKDTDFTLLKNYKKLYKKKIFILRRSEVAAWLFMYFDQREMPQTVNIKKPSSNDRKKSSIEAKPSAGEITLSEDQSKRLFISIGKNRRLFPRDIITLVISKTSAVKEDIGLIKILDNYSFVQVKDDKADEIINALTGLKFRGRTLSVNYAKPRSGEADNER